MANWQQTYEQLKKKKKEIDKAGDLEEVKKINQKYEVKPNILNMDYAPTNRTPLQLPSYTKAPATTKKKEEKRTWFSGGAFKDGYDFGDITKTILGTAGDVGTNVVKGVASAGEGLAKLTVGGIAEVSDWVGADDFSKKLKNRLAGKDEEFNKRKDEMFVSSKLNKVSDKLDSSSLIGEKTDDLASSVGNLGGAMAGQVVGIPWYVTMGGSSAGHELENAYTKGATTGEAWGSAVITGASEVLLEKLSGGIKFGGKTLDEGAKKLLSDAITNKTAKTLTKFGFDMLGEGTEEVLTEVVQNVGKKLTYEDEQTWGEILASEEALDSYLEAFIGGAVMGGGFNAGRLKNSLQTGQDYDSVGANAQEIRKVQEDIAPVNEQVQQTLNPQETIEDIDNQIAVLEEQLMATESETEYENLSKQIKELEIRAEQIENGTAQQIAPVQENAQNVENTVQNNVANNVETPNVVQNNEIAPVQMASVEQTNQPTTQQTESNLATEVESNTQNIENDDNYVSDKNIKDVSTGYSNDEYYSEMQYIQDGKIVGTLKYGEYNGEPNVKMIEVEPEYRRKGIGKKLLQELQKKYDGIEIDFGMSTPDGTKLLENITYTVDDVEVIEKQKRIDEIKKIIEEYDKGFANYFDNDLPVPKGYAEDYNELYDEQRKLEEEIRWKTPTKTFVKIDNNSTNAVENDTKRDTQTQQNVERTTPTQEELDNLEYTRKNKSGSEYASAFYDLDKKYGSANLYKGLNHYKSTGKALDNDIAPIRQELAETTKELVKTIKDTGKAVKTLKQELNEAKKDIKALVEENRALTEADLPMVEQEALNNMKSATDDMAPVIEDTTPDYEFENDNEGSKSNVIDPMQDRDFEDVGNRKVKAYQYEHPEVRPYFQEMAQYMLADLNYSQKGQRYVIGDISQTGGGNYSYSGQKRHTTSDIAGLLDSQYNYTYADIEKGLKAIIEDHGAENIAVAKRIEFALNDRLLNGYTDVNGFKIPPNQDYINLLRKSEWNNYYNSIPTNDIAPYEATSEEVSKSDIAPINKQYEAIEPTPTDFDNGGPMLKVSPKMEQKTTNKNVDWDSLEDTSKGEQQHLKVNKLGETLTPNNKDLGTLEDTSKGNQQQFNTETNNIEDSIEKKTKKEIKAKLLRETGILNTSLDEANNIPKLLMENTDPIRLQEMIFGRGLGNQINKMFFQKVKDNTSEKIRFQNKERAEIKELGIKAKSKESSAVQKYGEKQWTNETTGETLPYGDKELASEFPDVETQKKIKKASQIIRNKYDTYLDRTNEVLTKLGYDAIPKRKDYMRHFHELNDIFSRVGIPYNYNEMTANDLPTDINGLTADFSPSKNFFASTLQRKGNKTTYDAITGIDGYLEGIGNLIYHTEDIQRLRAYEQHIRDTYGENHGFDNLETLTDEEKVTRIEKIQDNHLSNYASWLHEYTNTLAGKKALIDRSIEGLTGRKIYSFLNTTKTQVGRNMIGFNLSSAMTNAIAGVQSLAKTNKLASVKGLADTVKNVFVKDGFVEKNNFLTSRFGSDRLSKNLWQRMGDAGFVFMQGTDYFVSNFVVRSKYNELKAKGLSDSEAHIEAGKYASRIMSDRSQGATANIYNSQTLGLVTQFQNEVNNQLYSMFYDTYHESRESAKGNALKTAAGMTFTLGQMAVFTHLFGKAFESMAGYNPTFDIIGMFMKALGLDDEEDEEESITKNVSQAFNQLVDALPYVNLITGGGRIPVSEAFTGVSDTFKALTGGKDQYGQDVSWEDALKSIKESAPYFLLPSGYSQIKKTTKGLGMYDEDLPIAGSYTDSGNLRFTAEEDTWSKIQAGLFGQWANDEAQAYVDSDFKSINKSNIEELIDLGMTSSEYRKLKSDINKSGKKVENKVDYIATLDELNDNQKNILVNNILDRDYEVDVSNYEDYSSYEEFDYSYKNPEKYEWLKSEGISYNEYSASDESKELYNYAYKYPETYKLGKSITGDFATYKEYADYIWDLKADKDENGDSISGTKKAKVIEYVNGLDLSIPQKAMLIRKTYSSFDDYNYDIVDYVDSLDMPYEDKTIILKALDMEVSDDGTISW